MADQLFLSVEEVAKRLGLNRSTVYRLVREGALPGFKVGGQWRFGERALRDWAAERLVLGRMLVNKNIDQDRPGERRSA